MAELNAFYAAMGQLKSPSREDIVRLTNYAMQFQAYAPAIMVQIFNTIVSKGNEEKLSFLYLIDSIVKSSPEPIAASAFCSAAIPHIGNIFMYVFQQCGNLRPRLHKLFCTWFLIFPKEVLNDICRRAQQMDPNWPIQDVSFHINKAVSLSAAHQSSTVNVNNGSRKRSPISNNLNNKKFNEPNFFKLTRKFVASENGEFLRTYKDRKQCPNCGMNFDKTGNEINSVYSQHLDWHFQLNKNYKNAKIGARPAYSSVAQWLGESELLNNFCKFDIAAAKIDKEEKKKDDKAFVSCAVCTGLERDQFCGTCGEELELFYSQEHEEWHYKHCVRPPGKPGNRAHHRACLE